MTIQEKVLKRGEDDWIYLAEVASLVRQEMPDANESTIRECTLRVLRELTETGLVVIGDLSGRDGDFVSWKLSTAEALERIRDEWENLGAPINLGDICWLSNTTEGDKKAGSLPNI